MNRFNFSILPKKNYLRLLLSYTGIVIFSVVILSAILLNFYSQLYSESLNNLNSASLSESKRRFENDVLNNLNFLSSKISSMQYEYVGYNFFYVKTDSIDNASITSFIRLMNNDVRQRSNIISNIQLYFNHNDLLVSSNGFYRNYQDNYNKNERSITYPLSYEAFINNNVSYAWIPTGQIDTPIAFLRKTPYGFENYNDFSGILRINLNRNAFGSIFANDDIRSTLLYDASMNTVLYPETSQTSENIALFEPNGPLANFIINSSSETSFQMQINEEKMNITCMKIDDTSLVLISMIPQSYFYEPLQNMKQRTYIICAFALFFGFIVSILFTSRLYLPIRKLLAKAISFSPTSNQKKASFDEYKTINESVEAMSNTIQSLDTSMKNYLPAISNNFFSGLLQGHIKSPTIVEDNLTMLNFHIAKEPLNLIIIDFVSTTSEKEHEEYIAFYTIFNYAETLNNAEFSLRVANYQNKHIAIFLQCDGSQNLQNELSEKILQFAAQAEIEITIVLHPLETIANSAQAYNKILRILEYSYFLPLQGKTLLAESFTEDVFALELPKTFYEEFTQALHATDIVLIKEHFVALAQTMQFPLKYSAKTYFEAMHNYEEIVRKFITAKIFSDFYSTYESFQVTRLACSNNFTQWANAMLDLCEECFVAIQNKNFNKNHEKISYLKSYMEEHIAENLSLLALSTELRMSPQYLSKIFKDIEGVNIVQYINELKMRMSCELLLTTDKSINTIAQELGFSGTAYFISTFKKFYKQTPRDFRNKKYNKK